VAVWGEGDTVIAGGAGAMLRSTDGGLTWAPIAGAPASGWAPGGGFSGLWGEGSTLFALAGHVLRSSDGGATWQIVHDNPGAPPALRLQGLAGAASTLVAPVWGAGGLLQSVDGGDTWNERPVLSNHRPEAAWMRDQRLLLIVGEGGLIARGTR
jgi:photosystem II stability/assembly factor-like uncharacterized protein